jgi:hypothetical protein
VPYTPRIVGVHWGEKIGNIQVGRTPDGLFVFRNWDEELGAALTGTADELREFAQLILDIVSTTA